MCSSTLPLTVLPQPVWFMLLACIRYTCFSDSPLCLDNIRLTITGDKFQVGAMLVFMGDSSCTDVQPVSGSEFTALTCLLPAGTGVDRPVRDLLYKLLAISFTHVSRLMICCNR